MLKEFRDFIARGNVIDLAVAVIIGAAFGKIVTSLVEGIVMPSVCCSAGSISPACSTRSIVQKDNPLRWLMPKRKQFRSSPMARS